MAKGAGRGGRPGSHKGQRPEPPRQWERIYLKEWLELLGKSQTELAAHTGQSETIISLIANGKRRYNQEFLESAAAFLRIQPSDLLHPPPEASVWAAWASLDADGLKTVKDVLFAIRSRSNR